METAKFYHAGCSVCVAAENRIVDIINQSRYNLEVVNIGEDKSRISEAEDQGVNSVPALVLGNEVLHINFGASIDDVKNS